MGAVAEGFGARTDVAIGGGGMVRGDAQGHDAPAGGELRGGGDGGEEAGLVADDMVGGQHEAGGAGGAALGHQRADRHGRGAVAALGLQHDVGGDADGGELFGADEAEIVVGDDDRPGKAVAGDPAGDRPEPGSGAAGHDDRQDLIALFHGFPRRI